MLKASGQVGRHGRRDRTLVLLAYRHGLRVSELVTLRWDQVDLKAGLCARRAAEERHRPPRTRSAGPELRALRELRRQYPESPYLFVTERGGPTDAGDVAQARWRAPASSPPALPYPSAHAAALHRLQARQ